jgi:hypothetical protein
LTQNVLYPMMFCFRTFRPVTRILHTGATLVIRTLHSEAAPVVRKFQTRAVLVDRTSTQGHFQLAYPIQGQLLQLSAHSIQGQLQLPAHFSQGNSSCQHTILRGGSRCSFGPCIVSSSCPYTLHRAAPVARTCHSEAHPVAHALHSKAAPVVRTLHTGVDPAISTLHIVQFRLSINSTQGSSSCPHAPFRDSISCHMFHSVKPGCSHTPCRGGSCCPHTPPTGSSSRPHTLQGWLQLHRFKISVPPVVLALHTGRRLHWFAHSPAGTAPGVRTFHTVVAPVV